MAGSAPPAARPRRGVWRARITKAVVAGVTSLVVMSLLGEWAVRRRERTRTTVPGTMSQLFYRHSRLMHGMVRGFDYYGWLQIGRQGFRGSRDVAPRADSLIRIIAVGGSATFDGQVSGDSSAWPARLEQILNSSGPTARYQVLNAGVPGFLVFDDLVRLVYELHAYQPDIIILYQGHNNLFSALAGAGQPSKETFDPRPDEVATVLPWQRWLERHSLLYNKLRSRLEAVQTRSAGATSRAIVTELQYDAAIEDGAARFARDVRMFVAAARALEIEVIIPQLVYSSRPGAHPDSALVSLWSRAMPYAPPQVVWRGYARFDSAARAVATSLGAQHVPVTDSTLWLLDNYAAGDPFHFNDRGAMRWAEQLARFIAAGEGRRSRKR